VYGNNKEVQFSDSEDKGPSQITTKEPLAIPESPALIENSDQEEVSQLLDSATQRVEGLITTVSSQPQTPQTVPGGLPSTPSQTSQPYLPTPLTTTLPPALPPVCTQTPTPSQCPNSPAPSSFSSSSSSASMSGSTMSHKMLGSPPEPFDGKPDKAEAFWNNLENYYYLNEGTYTTESKKVSSALTHFKISTSAGE
jgi:hypothetical protein